MKRFTDKYIGSLKPRDRAYEVSDPGARGLRVVVWPSNKKSFIVRYQRPDSERPDSKKSAKLSLGWIPLAAARKAAGDVFEELRHGRDPSLTKQDAKAKAAAAAADTVQAVCAEYMKRAGKNLRTFKQREKNTRPTDLPTLGPRPISMVTKLDCIRLFDQIADESGPVMVDYTRAILSKIFNWHEGRHDTFASPPRTFDAKPVIDAEPVKALPKPPKPEPGKSRARDIHSGSGYVKPNQGVDQFMGGFSAGPRYPSGVDRWPNPTRSSDGTW